MRLLFIVLWYAGSALLHAQEGHQPSIALVLIKGSQSPDGRMNITISDTNPHLDGDGFDANIREIKTGKSLYKFDWMNGPRPAKHPDENALSISWRQDSKAFATGYEVAYGESDCSLYARFADGQFREIELPSLKLLLDDKYSLHSKGKGYTSLVKWLPYNRFIIQVSDARWDKDYRVTLGFSLHSLSISAKAIIESIHPISKSEPDFHP